MQLWDLGAAVVNNVAMATNYIHGCHAVLLVYDVTQARVRLFAGRAGLVQHSWAEATAVGWR